MPALDNAEASRLVNASFGTAAYTAPTTPMKVALTTTTGTAAAAGTEVVGGSYARQNVTMTAASNGSASSNVALNYTNMPAATVTAVEVFDSAVTPRREWYGALTGGPKTVAAGDTLSIASGSLTAALS